MTSGAWRRPPGPRPRLPRRKGIGSRAEYKSLSATPPQARVRPFRSPATLDGYRPRLISCLRSILGAPFGLPLPRRSTPTGVLARPGPPRAAAMPRWMPVAPCRRLYPPIRWPTSSHLSTPSGSRSASLSLVITVIFSPPSDRNERTTPSASRLRRSHRVHRLALTSVRRYGIAIGEMLVSPAAVSGRRRGALRPLASTRETVTTSPFVARNLSPALRVAVKRRRSPAAISIWVLFKYVESLGLLAGNPALFSGSAPHHDVVLLSADDLEDLVLPDPAHRAVEFDDLTWFEILGIAFLRVV